ncbi:hypothetical protein HYALB_00012579 [Hymenoscyphus albidus]|uniref:RING-type domain-containing protein n=1 Tax=Hymenoscyphus albidus TaxID=595503 RepID=A0A9N9Q6U1_9HELO|nr:hypothetical protein HYALB_00012579 [Hymenoscyphus albidus]
MTKMAAARRSPRTIARFNHNFLICDSQDITATVLSLATCTGWSADHISITIEKEFNLKFTPEHIWDFHSHWITTRKRFTQEDRATMWWLMRCIGVHCLQIAAKPLNMTPRPISVEFQPTWSPKNNHGRELCPGFSPFARESSKLWMMKENTTTMYGKLTPSEEPIIQRFGPDLYRVVRKCLRRWSAAMLSLLDAQDQERKFAPINEKVQVDLIMDYLRYFQHKYEKYWGIMEEIRGASVGEGFLPREQAVHINSTGYGAKVLVGLLMADRLHVVDRLRFNERAKIGYREIKPADLKENCKDCAICQEKIGEGSVETGEVADEVAVELVICCGNTIGMTCLREWLKPNAGNGTCPICRHRFSPDFCQKLMEGYADKELAERNEKNLVEQSIVDLRSPSPAMPDPENIRGDRGHEIESGVLQSSHDTVEDHPHDAIQDMVEEASVTSQTERNILRLREHMEVEYEENLQEQIIPMELDPPPQLPSILPVAEVEI